MDEGQAPSHSTQSNFWLLRVVFRGRWGRWLTGLCIFLLTLALFVGFGGLLEPPGDGRVSTGVALFFCVILAYVAPIHHYICERADYALDQVAATEPMFAGLIGSLKVDLRHKSRPWLIWTLTIGFLFGLAHNALLLSEDELFAGLSNPRTAMPTLITLIIWVLMTSLISSLVEIALMFRRLAKTLPVDPLTARTLTPIGSVAVSTTLAIIGAQAAFPLMFLDPDLNPVTFIPGFIATAVPMLFIFLMPVWPAHRRLANAKRAALFQADTELQQLRGSSASTRNDYVALQPVLTYRREISEAPEWPFDTSVVGRLLLYLIIPPLTWVGAALIEILVDTAI